MGKRLLAFQFTRPRGARLRWASAQVERSSFNSRAREGRDKIRLRRSRTLVSFNSRAREGRDLRAERS